MKAKETLVIIDGLPNWIYAKNYKRGHRAARLKKWRKKKRKEAAEAKHGTWLENLHGVFRS
jgi:hypothetical protein